MADEGKQSGGGSGSGSSGGGGYTVDPSAPYNEITIGDKRLVRGGEPVSLTKQEVQTLEEQGLRITQDNG